MAEKDMIASQRKVYSYFEQDPELRVLFIFNDDLLNDELSQVAWKDGYRYVVFAGDWFTCKYLLDTEWENDKVILYIRDFSPLGSGSKREIFPLMDVLVANAEYHHDDFQAFMQQHNIPASMATFVERNVILLQTGKMMDLLEPHYNDNSISVDVAARGILSMLLCKKRVLDWERIIILVLLLGRHTEREKRLKFYAGLLKARMVLDILDSRLKKTFGVGLMLNSETKVDKVVEAFKYNAIVQDLAAVEADDYKDCRVDGSMALLEMNTLLELIMSQPKISTSFKELLAELGYKIRCEEIIKWYGVDADYRFIPDDLCVLVLCGILDSDISGNPRDAMTRVGNLMTKRGDDARYRDVMDFVALLAQYYETATSLERQLSQRMPGSPDGFVQLYVNELHLVDQLYRQALESFYRTSVPGVLQGKMQGMKERLDGDYFKMTYWTNVAWTGCIKASGGFGTLGLERQWNFYAAQVRPISANKVAVIVCDALRYEMAAQLVGELSRLRHTARISAMLATLPTETKFCKPSLLPHRELALRCTDGKDPDLSVDCQVLDNTDKRSVHLQSYRDDAICMQFERIYKNDTHANREIFKKHHLVYIFHDNIDEAGHSNTSRQIVEGCASAIRDIARVVFRILSSCNVTKVVVTSDHGFLFNDVEFADKDKSLVPEDFIEKKSRYYLTMSDGEVHDVVKFPLEDVSGIRNAAHVNVAVPSGTNRFAAPGGYTFAHGGASLQEMVIPVIMCYQERTDIKEPVGVTILDRRLSMVASRLRFDILQTEAVGMDRKERIVTVALYQGDEMVTSLREIRLDRTAPQLDDRRIPVDLTLSRNVRAKVLQLKVYDIEDGMNPLVKENVTNNTLIENDFDF